MRTKHKWNDFKLKVYSIYLFKNLLKVARIAPMLSMPLHSLSNIITVRNLDFTIVKSLYNKWVCLKFGIINQWFRLRHTRTWFIFHFVAYFHWRGYSFWECSHIFNIKYNQVYFKIRFLQINKCTKFCIGLRYVNIF